MTNLFGQFGLDSGPDAACCRACKGSLRGFTLSMYKISQSFLAIVLRWTFSGARYSMIQEFTTRVAIDAAKLGLESCIRNSLRRGIK
ncbi:MAG: hypothetical protein WBP44_07990 [Gammaproteobacteria bacterium]